MTCTRFDDEGLLALELGEALDPHFSECTECLRARREHDALVTSLIRGDDELALSDGWEETLLGRVRRRATGVEPSSASRPLAGDVAALGDFDLLRDWASGDRAAGSRLFERYFADVRRFFANKVGGDEMQDLVQATFERCLEGIERHTTKTFRAFIFGVARHVLNEHVAKAARELQAAGPTVADVLPDSRFPIQERAEIQVLLAALRRLPLDEQVCLELHYWHGIDGVELAEALGISESDTRSRLRRAREHLRSQMAEGSPQDVLSDPATWEHASEVLARTHRG